MEIKSADLHVRNLIEVSSFSPPFQSFSVNGIVTIGKESVVYCFPIAARLTLCSFSLADSFASSNVKSPGSNRGNTVEQNDLGDSNRGNQTERNIGKVKN